jgi:hypothetical protein
VRDDRGDLLPAARATDALAAAGDDVGQLRGALAVMRVAFGAREA